MTRGREIRELTRVRFLLFFREPEAVFWVFVFPVILAVVLGFAFSEGEPEPSRVGVPAGPTGDALAGVLEAEGRIDVLRFEVMEEARRRLARGGLDAVVQPGAPPEVRYDPVRPEATLARYRVLEAWRRSRSADEGPVLREVESSEKGSRYIDFLFPGLLGMNLMGTGIWSIGFAIADTRQKKLLKRMLVTPMRRSSFLVSFMLFRTLFMVVEMTLLVVFGMLVLGVPLEGPLLAFALLCLLGSMCFAGLGLLIASRARTIEGVSGIMNFAMMPMWLCSGVFFSYERFPEFLHPVLQAIPLTALNDGLRGVMLDGSGLAGILPEAGIVVLWGVVSFALALRIFRWE